MHWKTRSAAIKKTEESASKMRMISGAKREKKPSKRKKKLRSAGGMPGARSAKRPTR